MKNPKDGDYYVLIPNPFTGEKEEFDIDGEANASLAIRLIKKRDKILGSVNEKMRQLREIRESENLDELEAKTKQYIKDLTSLSPSDFDSEEEFDKKSDELIEEISSLKESYPEKAVNLQNRIEYLIYDADRIGLKICSLILNPVNGIPDEYDNKHSYISELIDTSSGVNDIITFFLNTLSFTTRLRRESGIRMKSRKNDKEDLEN